MSEDLENIENKGEKPEDLKPQNDSGENKPSEANNDLKAEETPKEENIPEVKPESAEKPEEINSEIKEEKEPLKEEKLPIIPLIPKESNYQVSLINENLLRIRVSTVKSVNIDCSVKDRTSATGDASESQSNKIQIHPKPDNQPQEVEIIISIDPDSGNIVVEKKKIIR
jgi:hypothetical protein